MKKQLIIIVYKISVDKLTRQQAQEQMSNFMESCRLSEEEDLKEHYIIKEIWLPTQEETDVNVIYPTQNQNVELDEIYKEMYKHIDNDPNSSTSKELNKILRSIKLKNIEKV